jgi:hypothetical protein
MSRSLARKLGQPRRLALTQKGYLERCECNGLRTSNAIHLIQYRVEKYWFNRVIFPNTFVEADSKAPNSGEFCQTNRFNDSPGGLQRCK